MAQRRIMKELSELEKKPLPYILSVNPVEGDIFNLKAKMAGPPDSPYEGAVLEIDITLPFDYPLKPPSTRFNPTIYHANVGHGGLPECFPLQYKDWKPTHTIKDVLEEMYDIVQEPRYELCLGDAGFLYERDIKEYKRKAREYTLNNNMKLI